MDPQKLQLFRQRAIEMGYKPKDVDTFIEQKRKEQATLSLIQQGAINVQDIAKSNPELAQRAIKEQGFKPTKTAKQQDKEVMLDETSGVLKTVIERFDSIPQEKRGPLVGNISKLIPGVSDETRQYEDLRRGVASSLKQLVGESGVLTDTDIQRIVNLLPSPTETERKNQLNKQDLQKFLKAKGVSLSIPGQEEEKKPQGAMTTTPDENDPMSKLKGNVLAGLFPGLMLGRAPVLKDTVGVASRDLLNKVDTGQNVSFDDALGAGGEFVSTAGIPLTGGGSALAQALKLGGLGAVRGATTPGASLEGRAGMALIEGLLGGALGGGAGAANAARKVISGAAKGEAAVARNKLAQEVTKTLPVNSIVKEGERITKNLPATAAKWEQEVAGLTDDVTPTNLLEKIDFWGQAYKASGELKDTASAKLYGALQRKAKDVLRKEAPQILKAHEKLQREAAKKGFVGGILSPTNIGRGAIGAATTGGALFLLNKLLGQR